MIQELSKVNTSKKVRAPELYDWMEWSDDRGYELLIMEYVSGRKLVGKPDTADQIKDFFDFLHEYQSHCINNPWLEAPIPSISETIRKSFLDWRTASDRLFPEHKLRESGDDRLINKAIKILMHGYEGVGFEFMHGHLSVNDVVVLDRELVMLSNLYWSWRVPFYDAVFAYHWNLLELAGIESVKTSDVDRSRAWWMREMEKHVKAKSDDGLRLWQLALLERATVAITIDGLMMKPTKLARYVMELRRREAWDLIKVLG
jgi:hypothetical protein